MNQRDHSGFLKLMGYSVKMYNMGTIMDIEQRFKIIYAEQLFVHIF